MKSDFNKRYILQIILLFLSFQTIFPVDFNYPSAIGLPNGNIFLVEKKGIFVYDEQLINIIYNYNFQINEEINDVNKLSNIVIKYKYDYIICIINLKVYFFNDEGNKLLETDKIITDENISYISLTPVDLNEDNSYYYVLSYFSFEDSLYKQKHGLYKIDLINMQNVNITKIIKNSFYSHTWNNNRKFLNKGLACEYMQHKSKNQDNFLVCFFIIEIGSSYSLTQYFFEVKSNSIAESSKYGNGYVDNIDDIKQIQSITSSDMKNTLACLLFTDESLACYKFNYPQSFWKSGEFYQLITTNFNCRNKPYAMKLNYLIDMQTISLSCINPVSTIQAAIFDDDLELSKSFEQFTNCSSIFGHSILKLKSDSNFYAISDVICDNIKRSFEPLEGTLSPIQVNDISISNQISEIIYPIEEKEETEEEIYEEEKSENEKKVEKEEEKEIEKENEEESEKVEQKDEEEIE